MRGLILTIRKICPIKSVFNDFYLIVNLFWTAVKSDKYQNNKGIQPSLLYKDFGGEND
jgi:uncharacterized protein (UPF0262 family)